MPKVTPLLFSPEDTPETCGLPVKATYHAVNPEGGHFANCECYRATVLALARRGWKMYKIG